MHHSEGERRASPINFSSLGTLGPLACEQQTYFRSVRRLYYRPLGPSAFTSTLTPPPPPPPRKTFSLRTWQYYPREDWIPQNNLREIALSIRRTLSIWGPGISSFNISPSLIPIFLYQLCSGRNNFEEFKTAEIRLQQCADFLLKSFALLSVSRNCIFIRMEAFLPNFGAVKSSLFHHFKLGS